MTTTMPTAIERYRLALNSRSRTAYLAAFAPDAVLLDPYGPRMLQGVEGLNKFFDGFERTWGAFEMTFGEAYAAADRIAVTWQVSATAHTGRTAQFAGINVFTVDEAGLLTRLEGYWDFKAMAAQLK